MRVAVAGTFGPIHDGHRALFETALERGEDGVVVGLTSDDLARETRGEPRPVPPYEERRDRGLEPLEGIVVPFVRAADGERISSTRLVRGEIDEHGALSDAGG